MARKRKGSPNIDVEITEENWEAAIASNSGGCLIADALKRMGYSGVSVDMATIRVTDSKEGMRYTYLAPSSAQHLLLNLDQGWPNSTKMIHLRRAVKITPVTTSKARAARRRARLAELETKEAAGTLTRDEKAALTRIRSHPERASTTSPSELTTGGSVFGGKAPVAGPAHPNLLRGRNRIFGAKLADPGQAFQQAVAAEIQLREEAAEASS